MITNENVTALSIFPWGWCRPIKDCEDHLICAISIGDIRPLCAHKKGERERQRERQTERQRDRDTERDRQTQTDREIA